MTDEMRRRRNDFGRNSDIETFTGPPKVGQHIEKSSILASVGGQPRRVQRRWLLKGTATPINEST